MLAIDSSTTSRVCVFFFFSDLQIFGKHIQHFRKIEMGKTGLWSGQFDFGIANFESLICAQTESLWSTSHCIRYFLHCQECIYIPTYPDGRSLRKSATSWDSILTYLWPAVNWQPGFRSSDTVCPERICMVGWSSYGLQMSATWVPGCHISIPRHLLRLFRNFRFSTQILNIFGKSKWIERICAQAFSTYY